MRELSGVNICTSLNCENSQYTPDPTVLLDSTEWRKLFSSERVFKTNKKKIFIYSCYLSREELIGKFANLEDYEIIIEDVVNDDSDIAQLTLENWIQAIDEADYVITNSFHATMFSLYMNTPFITFKYSAANKSRMNTRLDSILSQVKLTERFVSLDTNINDSFKILTKEIDWFSVNKELDIIRQIGTEYLKESIQNIII